jgi:hypothetical protein
MKRTLRIVLITVIIIAIGVVMMFITPGTLRVGNYVYSNTYETSPENTLKKYYDEIKLEQSIGSAETDNTCLFLYFNGKTINVCEMTKNDGKYCYYGEKTKYKYNTDYMVFNANTTQINNDIYYWDIIYQNRKLYVRDDDYKFIDFTVTIEGVEETRNLTFVYKIDKA